MRPLCLFLEPRVKGRNIKAIIAYDGTDFFGWQIQPGKRTVQGVLEKKISRLVGEEIRLFAAGRTDRGVHASGQVVSFVVSSGIPAENLRLALNMLIPRDIFIKEASEVPSGFHARYSAKERTYLYHLGLWGSSRSPFRSRYCWYPERPLDFRVIERSTRLFRGMRDFRALAKRSELGDNTCCHIHEITWLRNSAGYSLRVSANRFLPQMMRRVVAVLVDIGSNKIKPTVLEEILNGEESSWSQPWVAPPHGLFLQNVRY